MTPHAITRAPSPNLAACELTHLQRTAIDVEQAQVEHAAYEQTLAELGCTLERLPPEPDLPDSVFVEDTAIVLPELAVITRPGAPSRRPETDSIAAALGRHRPLQHISEPAILDGGDVLRIDRTLYVGLTSRSNQAAIDQLREFLAPHDYTVHGVSVSGCLHLKSAVSWLGGNSLLLNPHWIDAALFTGFECIPVDPAEPGAANVLRIGETLLAAASDARTRAKLERHGYALRAVDITELSKAEAAMTCSSLILDAEASHANAA